MAPTTANPTSYTAGELPLTIENQPTRTGHAFTGWTGSNGSTPQISVTIAKGATGNLAYTANWTANTYTVTYNANGGDGTMENQTAAYGQDLRLTANTFTRTGYTFTGWNTQANGGGLSYADGAYFEPWKLTSGLSLYAQWTQNAPTMHTVRFLDWDGTVIISLNIAHGETLTIPTNPARAGFTFTGWSPAVVTTVTAPADYTAQYEALPTYTVTYAPGLHGTFAAVSTPGLAAGAPTPAAPGITGEDGWIFTGWTPVPTATVTRNVTYVAQWAEDDDPNTFTVTFVDWNGAVLKTEEVAPGGDATAPASPAREGYTFEGWNRAFTNVQANITVTAQYILNPVSGTGEQPGTTPEGGGGTATPPGGGGGTTTPPGGEGGGVTVPGAADPANPTPEEVLTALVDEGMPSVVIGDQEVPLAAGPFTQFVWALLNLILALTGVVLAVIGGIHALLRKKRERDGVEDEYETEEETKKRKRRRMAWLIAGIVLGIAGIVVFLLTEDMSRLMVLVDDWTLVNAAIFVAEFVGMFFSFKRKKAQRVEETEEQPA